MNEEISRVEICDEQLEDVAGGVLAGVNVPAIKPEALAAASASADEGLISGPVARF